MVERSDGQDGYGQHREPSAADGKTIPLPQANRAKSEACGRYIINPVRCFGDPALKIGDKWANALSLER